MKIGKAKLLGIIVLFLSFLIASVHSIAITNFSVLDTDASTYIIVVILMLFVFICFSLKESIDLEYRSRNILYAAIIFLIYLIMFSYLRVLLSSAFLSYRIDTLLFPLLLLTFITLLFGTSGVKKLYPLIIYSAFASPLILLPLLNLNLAFANINALIVYNFVKTLGISASRIGLMILANAGSSITVSTTCVSIGTFVAFVMFMIPVAYFYEGSLKRKFYWIFSGAILILILNLLRMLSITLVWIYYGIGSALNLFHLFAGQFIFYFAIIIMVLLSYKYGLDVKRIQRKSLNELKNFYKTNDKKIYLTIFISFIIAIIAFGLNYSLLSAFYAPATSFGNNSSIDSVVLNQYIISSIESAKSNVIDLGSSPNGGLFSLINASSTPNDSIYILANTSYSPNPNSRIIGYSPITNSHSYLLRNGIAINAQKAFSGNYSFYVNYFSIPYNVSGNFVSVNYLLFEKVDSNSSQSCALINYNSIGLDNYLQSMIYNFINVRNFSNNEFLCQGYWIASSR